VTVKLQLADPKQDISISNMCEPESSMNQIDPQIISRDMNTGEVELEFHAQKRSGSWLQALSCRPRRGSRRRETQSLAAC